MTCGRPYILQNAASASSVPGACAQPPHKANQFSSSARRQDRERTVVGTFTSSSGGSVAINRTVRYRELPLHRRRMFDSSSSRLGVAEEPVTCEPVSAS